MKLDSLQLQFCDIQGRLFELSAKEGYDSEAFIDTFMNSPTAAHFDLPYSRTQWMGEEYLLEEIVNDSDGLPRGGELFNIETLYWTGYVYRYWHLLTDESSASIYAIADAQTMRRIYPGFHTLDVEEAIARLKEIER